MLDVETQAGSQDIDQSKKSPKSSTFLFLAKQHLNRVELLHAVVTEPSSNVPPHF